MMLFRNTRIYLPRKTLNSCELLFLIDYVWKQPAVRFAAFFCIFVATKVSQYERRNKEEDLGVT